MWGLFPARGAERRQGRSQAGQIWDSAPKKSPLLAAIANT